ncbi:MAG: peptidylprolyl isomerase [Clostridiales bacterium]|nr:peptidylprolyl isomerase [Clostridiales bacterium]
MKKISALLLLISLMTLVMLACSKDDNEDLLKGKHYVEIEVEDYGTIKVELDADKAPITVTNFINLVQDGFYDGLTFHRIIEGFMIQGGDPNGDGTGGSDKNIKGEFKNNGVDNPLSHTRGAISMARAPYSYDSASSQFFIVQADSLFLDGEYAVFGYVTEGMEVVDKICEETPVLDDNGNTAKEDQPIIKTIRVIDK